MRNINDANDLEELSQPAAHLHDSPPLTLARLRVSDDADHSSLSISQDSRFRGLPVPRQPMYRVSQVGYFAVAKFAQLTHPRLNNLCSLGKGLP